MKMLYALIAIVGAQYVSAYLALPTFARLILQVPQGLRDYPTSGLRYPSARDDSECTWRTLLLTAMGSTLQVLAALVFPRLMAKIFPPETLVGKKAPPLEGLTYMHGEPAKLGNKGRVTGPAV
jgi:hypothetical protein